MLEFKINIVFPKLKYVGQANTQDGEIPKYVLDWLSFDEKVSEGGRLDCALLPDKYMELIKGPFAINADYMREIRHYTRLCVLERNRDRPFDTVIRDMCGDVYKTAANTAIKLVADCLYDESAQKYNRSGEGYIAKYAMMTAFWIKQTGIGLVRNTAELDELERNLKYFNGQNTAAAIGLLSAVTEHINNVFDYQTERALTISQIGSDD